MIAKFHAWTKLPINKGVPLCFEFNISGLAIIRKAKNSDDHNCFAAEDIKSRKILLSKVSSPVGIYLAINYFDPDVANCDDCNAIPHSNFCASCGMKLK